MSTPQAAAARKHGILTLVFSIVLAGLAAGALWCLLALVFERAAGWLIVPLGAAIGVYFRWLGIAGRRGVVCACIAVLLAFVYAQYLFAAIRVADMLGFSLRSTLFKMDWGLAWQATRANLGAMDFVALLAALLIACWIAARR